MQNLAIQVRHMYISTCSNTSHNATYNTQRASSVSVYVCIHHVHAIGLIHNINEVTKLKVHGQSETRQYCSSYCVLRIWAYKTLMRDEQPRVRLGQLYSTRREVIEGKIEKRIEEKRRKLREGENITKGK